MFISFVRMLDEAYWKYDNIGFLLGSLDDHGSSMVQIFIFLRADSPQLYQSEGKRSEAGGLSSQCHRCLVQDAGICLFPVWKSFGSTNTPSNLGAMSSALRRDPRTLTSLPEILSSLSSFQAEEAQLSNSLAELLKTRDPIHVSLNRLQSLVPQLDRLYIDATQLTRKVSNTAKTAERVGSRVRSLDEEMGRVRQAGDRVAQVMELKVI